MFIKENIMLAVAGIRANKMRSLLTMLGIIIGISSVIAIVSIGDIITSSVSGAMSEMGADSMYVHVRPKEPDDFNSRSEVEDSDLLTLDQIYQIKEKFSDRISDVSITSGGDRGEIRTNHKTSGVEIEGVTESVKQMENIKLSSGRFVSDKDVRASRKVAVVSDKVIDKNYKNVKNPLGKEVQVYVGDEIQIYTIVGVYKYEKSKGEQIFGGLMNMGDQTTMYIPVTTANLNNKTKNFWGFKVKPKEGIDYDKFVKDLNKYGDSLYRSNKIYHLEARNMQNELKSMTDVLGTISLAVSVIAAISLLVGGIGVMNIMLVSVTERTREIGTRKALGAKSSYIKMQFITEAIIICCIGGAIGVILGLGISMIGSTMLNMSFTVSIKVILISVAFSMGIGIFFGYYPANKAAKLDPIEALRYE